MMVRATLPCGAGKGVMLLLAAVLIGCASPYAPDSKRQPPKPPATQIDELFVPAATEGGKTLTVFRTNDPQYWTLNGATVWTAWGDSSAPFVSRTVAMGKPKGYAGGGYGVVFCQGDREVDGALEPTMLVAMVNNEGQYIIGKTIGGTFEDFGWWKQTPHLNRGAGAVNEVTVSRDEGSGAYSLFINGRLTEQFRDDSEPVHREGKNGYIVVITPFERFPGEEIDVYFTEER